MVFWSNFYQAAFRQSAYWRPSLSMPSLSRLVTSAETSPVTKSQMAATCCLKSTPPSFATREGFVVTPSTKPSAEPSRISSSLQCQEKTASDFPFPVHRRDTCAPLAPPLISQPNQSANVSPDSCLVTTLLPPVHASVPLACLV